MLRSNTLLPATFDDGLRYVYHRFRSLQLLIYTLLDNTLSEDERIRSPRYRLVAWFYHYASSCLDAHTGQSSGKFATGMTRQNITTSLHLFYPHHNWLTTINQVFTSRTSLGASESQGYGRLDVHTGAERHYPRHIANQFWEDQAGRWNNHSKGYWESLSVSYISTAFKNKTDFDVNGNSHYRDFYGIAGLIIRKPDLTIVSDG